MVRLRLGRIRNPCKARTIAEFPTNSDALPPAGAPARAGASATKAGPPAWIWHAALVVLVGVLAFLAWRRMASATDRDRYRDFYEFYCAAEALWKGGSARDVFAAGHLGYIYPPLLAVLLMVLVPLGIYGAAVAWTLCSSVLLWLSARIGARDIADRFGLSEHAPALAFGGAILLVDKLIAEFKMQQSNTLMLLSWTLALAWLHRRPALAGLALGFAANIKYVTLIAVPYFLIRGRWKAAAWTVGGTVLWALAPALIIGWERNLELMRGAVAGLLHASASDIDASGPADAARVISMRALGMSITSSIMESTAAQGRAWLALPLTGLVAGATLLAMQLMYARAGVPLWLGRFGSSEDAPARRPLVAMEWSGLMVAALVFSPQTNPRHLTQAVLVMMVLVAVAALCRGTNRVLAGAGIALAVLGFSLPPPYGVMRDWVPEWHRAAGPSLCLLIGWMMGMKGALELAGERERVGR